MALRCTVGGVKRTFEDRLADEVSGVLDRAFGGDDGWDRAESREFGEFGAPDWAALKWSATAELGVDTVPNLLALSEEGRGVYLPAHVHRISLPLPLSGGRPLCCASLTGLRAELIELAGRWGLPVDDDGLRSVLQAECAPEVAALARLMSAANEALRRDCPLWIFG